VDAPDLEKVVVSFGYAKPDTFVHNYWDERPAAQTDNDRVKWIVLARPQEKTLLLVLQSWATNDLTVKLTWNELENASFETYNFLGRPASHRIVRVNRAGG